MGIDENNSVFKKIKNDNHEQIVFCNDDKIGLKAIIGIHNTAPVSYTHLTLPTTPYV